MALTAIKTLQLLDRMYAYDAIASPSIYKEELLWTGTAISIAGVPLLIGEGQIIEIIETPMVTPVPGAGPWVLGVAAHCGGLLPVYDGDRLFRKPGHVGRTRDFCLVVDKPGHYFAITLSDILGNRTFPLSTLKQGLPDDPDFAEFCLGGFNDNDQFLALLDIDKLVTKSALFTAAISESGANEDAYHDDKQYPA